MFGLFVAYLDRILEIDLKNNDIYMFSLLGIKRDQHTNYWLPLRLFVIIIF